uniref:Uncharacterized protein n=1 Tax=Musca domestica TaxID=7370 RepID=A0A1I8M2F8_MUSDO
KGRECTTHEECAAIENSSCVRDPDDYKMRCLCGNDNPPNNGLCPDVVKGLRHRCSGNYECEDGLICTYENTNRTIGVAKFMSSKTKLCLCDNERGYFEDVHRDICSGGLRHRCSGNYECEDGLICTYENTNRTIGVAKFMSSKTKLCLCDNERGYFEDVHRDICSG